MLNDREKKFLEIAINSGSQPGEADNAATLFFRSLRKRGVTIVQFTEGIASLNGSGAPPPLKSAPDFGMCTMPWRKSKHYGKMFLDIPPSDLISALRWINEDPIRAQQMATLASQIQGFLNQAK
jgi:hypothetical protein